jgi:cytochrome c oxidase assembly protein subunit 11
MSDQQLERSSQHNKVIFKSSIAVVAMFGFGFLLIPLYDVLCDLTGINGKTANASGQDFSQVVVDENRWVNVEFVANRNGNIPWEFSATTNKMRVHPGKLYDAMFSVKNLTDKDMVGQAVPSLVPGVAAKYFNKTECFCFSQQQVQARQTRQMPLRFIINPELPKHVKTVTLSYTFFEIKETASLGVSGSNI